MRFPAPASWLGRYTALCGAGVVLGVLLLWLSGGFARLGLDLPGALALAAGIVLASAVGIGLMALIFYSNRSGRDDAMFREGDDRR